MYTSAPVLPATASSGPLRTRRRPSAPAWRAPLVASHTSPPSSVTLAGTLQSELGCPGDLQPECTVRQQGSSDCGSTHD